MRAFAADSHGLRLTLTELLHACDLPCWTDSVFFPAYYLDTAFEACSRRAQTRLPGTRIHALTKRIRASYATRIRTSCGVDMVIYCTGTSKEGPDSAWVWRIPWRDS